MEPPDPHPHFTLFLTLWGLIAPLAALGIGSLLQSSAQRRQWRRDCRRQEFRELITALAACTIDAVAYKHAVYRSPSRSPQLRDQLFDALQHAYKTILDRLYIAEDVRKADLGNRFVGIMNELRKENSSENASDQMDALLQEVVQMGIKD
jgi:hypothetical protein